MCAKSSLNNYMGIIDNIDNEYPDDIWLDEPYKDIEKLQYIHTQLKEIMEDEEKKIHSIKGRVKFFLGTLIASLTLILTVLSGSISSFKDWSPVQQIWLILVILSFLISVFFYLKIYFQTNNIESIIGNPLNENDSFLFIKNQLKTEEIIHISNYRYYKRILNVKIERKKVDKIFKSSDLAYFIGIMLCIVYALIMAPFSPTTVVFFVIALIMGYYLLITYQLAKEITIIGRLIKKWIEHRRHIKKQDKDKCSD